MGKNLTIGQRGLRNNRVTNLLIAILFLPMVLGSFFLSPSGHGLALPGGDLLGPMCLFEFLTTNACPSCGMMRSFVAMAHLDFLSAVKFHPAGPFMMLVYLYIVGAALWRGWRGKAALWIQPSFRRLIEFAAVTCLVVGVARYLVIL